MLLCTNFANRLEELFVEISRLELMIERNFWEAIGKICATESAVSSDKSYARTKGAWHG
jgi:hypothetical protein